MTVLVAPTPMDLSEVSFHEMASRLAGKPRDLMISVDQAAGNPTVNWAVATHGVRLTILPAELCKTRYAWALSDGLNAVVSLPSD